MKVLKEAAEGGGIDYVAEPLADPEDTLRFRVRGDLYPRVEIDPRGTIKTGPGSVGPTLIGGVGGPIINARNSYNVLDAGLVRTTDSGYPGSAAASIANSFAFALLVNQHVDESCDYLFPPGVYDTVGFHLTNPGQRIIGAGGAAADQGDPLRGTKFVHRHATNDCVRLIGVNGNRSFGMGAIGIRIVNQAAAPRGLVLEHLSHFYLEDVWVSSFRGAGGGLRAANTMDGALYDCCTDFCGSADASNLSAVLLTATDTAGAGTEDACNQIRFIRHRFENISDRVLEFKSVGGLLVNKIQFLATKFENSLSNSNGTNGSNDANQAYILLDHADWISFVQCDFTVQERQSAYVLPTLFRVKNSSTLDIAASGLFGGSLSATKVFTNYITAAAAGDVVRISDLVVNMANAGGYPTKVLKGNSASKPTLIQRGIGFDPFTGSAKATKDWYDPAEFEETAGVADPGSQQVNVKRWGALADGTTDDTAAIQSAIDNAPTGSTIYFPTGTYLISATIKLRDQLRYVGDMYQGGTIIKLANGTNLTTPLFAAKNWYDNVGSSNGVEILNIAFDGNKANNASSTSDGILLCNWQSVIRNCHVSNMKGAGIVLTDAQRNGVAVAGTVIENRIENCRIQTVDGRGIYVWEQSGSGKLTDGFCVNNLVNGALLEAIQIDRAAGWLIEGNHTYTGTGLGKTAIWAKSCFSTRIVNNYIDNYGQTATTGFYSGIRAEISTTRGSVISGNTISCTEDTAGSTYRHLYVLSGSGITSARAVVTNNVVAGASAANGTGIRIESLTGCTFDVMVAHNRIDACNTPFTGVATGTLRGRWDLYGAGTPEAAITAPIGSTWTRSDGGAATTLYVKESGTSNTGWVAK